MKRKSRIGTVAGALALCLAVPAAAQAAEPGNGWYVSGNVSAAIAAGAWEVKSKNDDGETNKSDFTYDTGYGLDAAVGYAFGNIRLEGEVSWSQLGVDDVKFNGSNLQVDGDWRGDVSALGLMANGWYDIATGTRWVPYVGGGLGAAWVEFGLGLKGTITDPADGSEESFDGSINRSNAWVFAYQVGAGIGYRVDDRAVVQFGYRFFGTSEGDFGGDKAAIRIHKISVGVRYSF